MHKARPDGVVLHRQALDAVIFDMDGVVTRTATLHAKAWKQTFDEFLKAKPGAKGSFRQFDIEADYRRYVDGKPRYDGVVSFLTSRGISLPYGSRDDPPESETICGVGNRKDLFFQALLASRGVDVFESTIELIRRLRAAGLKTGIFSASRHAEQVLSAADALSLFDAKVDGVDADRLGLEGKPHPATLIELAGRLGALPARTAVVKDAVAGVQAARAGGFSLVIGVNRPIKQGICSKTGRTWRLPIYAKFSWQKIEATTHLPPARQVWDLARVAWQASQLQQRLARVGDAGCFPGGTCPREACRSASVNAWLKRGDGATGSR